MDNAKKVHLGRIRPAESTHFQLANLPPKRVGRLRFPFLPPTNRNMRDSETLSEFHLSQIQFASDFQNPLCVVWRHLPTVSLL